MLSSKHMRTFLIARKQNIYSTIYIYFLKKFNKFLMIYDLFDNTFFHGHKNYQVGSGNSNQLSPGPIIQVCGSADPYP
jgi:hypothetical protein